MQVFIMEHILEESNLFYEKALYGLDEESSFQAMGWCQLDVHEYFWMILNLKHFLKKHHRQINTDLWRPCPLSSLSSCLEYCSHYYLQESPKSDIVGLSWLEIGVFDVLVILGILAVLVSALDVFGIGMVYLLHFLFGIYLYNILIVTKQWSLFIQTLN